MTAFDPVDPSVDLPDLDRGVLDLWDRVDAFHRSVEQRPPSSEYTFYDGPPFATGSPHYGHILQGVVKDIVPRYWTMRGHRVERQFGWDTHGLPVEMEVEKQFELSGPKLIEEYGIRRFNEACRSMVQNTTGEWEDVTRRIGRWVDFENDYKTMDPDFMESVWWVFRRLWDKGLIYRDFKVLPYSYGATTPLSNFEANMDYRDVDDPAITVRLEVLEGQGPVQAGDQLTIWTTTPWTLPSNLAIAVGEDIEYSRVDVVEGDHPGRYWVASALAPSLFGDDAAITATARGGELVGVTYEPPFGYFEEERDRGAFRVIVSDDVNTAEGTGLVHMAPAYGEADFVALQAAGLDVLVDPVDAVGAFTDAVPDVAGLNVKEADATLIRLLKESGKIIDHRQIRHSYPFCWRTETPLIYKAIPTWFVAVESFRDRMVELNKTIHWVPDAVGSRRFGNWLAGARDWAISRNRYWGSCIPVWECDGCREQACIGSREELQERSGVWLDDLHKHFVDEVTFPCSSCEGTMTRVPEVLDCWFESGAMPYAQIHYPFDNQDRFAQRFPANFIAEGLDQTRGWFYTLLVLSTALFDEAPFRNCVVTGLILAEDGRKMSKSLRNYPDPSHILDDFGADALRAYLINSPVVRADPLRFSETGVREVVRTVLLPLWNALVFFTTYAAADGIGAEDLDGAPPLEERPEIDRWIVSTLQSLISDVNDEMEGYRLHAVVPPILGFIDDLTNWYIRRSRRRFWSQRSDGTEADKLAAFATLYEVLVTFSRVAAPIIPFVTEELWQRLVVTVDANAADSVHLTDYPVVQHRLVDRSLERAMATVRTVVNLGRGLRKDHQVRVRQPLHSLTVITRDPAVAEAVRSHGELISEELNVKAVTVIAEEGDLLHLAVKPDFKVLGPRLGGAVKDVARACADLDDSAIKRLLDGDELTVAGAVLTRDDVVVERIPREGVVVASSGPIAAALDTTLDDDLVIEGIARELVNRVQRIRRDQALEVTDRIELTWTSEAEPVIEAFARHGRLIADEILATTIERQPVADDEGVELDVEGMPVTMRVTAVDQSS